MIREIVVAVSTAAVIALGALIKNYIKRRVHVSSPDTEKICAMNRTVDALVPTVNLLVGMAGPQTEALIALLEASKGHCNGNVDAALKKMRATRDKYDQFIQNAASIEEVSA